MDIDDTMIYFHEELIAEYMETNPGATEQEAYDATIDDAYLYAVDSFADASDYYHDLAMDK